MRAMVTPSETTTQAEPIEVDRLPLLLKRTEVARLARCCIRTIQRAESLGELPVARRGSGSTRTLYRRADVLRWLGLDEGTGS